MALPFALTSEQVDEMIRSAPSLRDTLLLRLLRYGGMRVTELVTIRREHVNLENEIITIVNLKQGSKVRTCVFCNRKVGTRSLFCSRCGQKLPPVEKEQVRRMRSIRIDPGTVELLRRYMPRLGKTPWLFPSPVDPAKHLTRQMVFYIVRDAARRVGVTMLLHPLTYRPHQVSPHRLRDFFAMTSLSNDSSLEAQARVQEQLGHVRFETTRRYLKWSVLDERAREWYLRTVVGG